MPTLRQNKRQDEEHTNIASKNGECLKIDISWIRKATFAGNRYWLLVMNE
jgi:hypothetical protein